MLIFIHHSMIMLCFYSHLVEHTKLPINLIVFSVITCNMIDGVAAVTNTCHYIIPRSVRKYNYIQYVRMERVLSRLTTKLTSNYDWLSLWQHKNVYICYAIIWSSIFNTVTIGLILFAMQVLIWIDGISIRHNLTV